MSDYRFEYLDLPQRQTPGGAGGGKPKGSRLWRAIVVLFQLAIIGILVVLVGAAGGYLYLSQQLEGHIDKVLAYQGQGPGGTPRFYDRNGTLLFELTTVEKRKWLTYSEIPQIVKDATVAVEDDTFWTNPGFDPAAIGAAILSNYRNEGDRPVGASTITQQLVRSIVFTYEERVGTSYERKIREIFLAGILTQKRSKESILTMYLNEIYYGNLAYGIEAAAQTYFGKPATELTLAEAALLVGLPQSPIELDPYFNFEAAKARQELVLDLLAEDGQYSAAEIEAAKAETLTLASLISPNEEAVDTVLEAAHFVVYVQRELERRYGPDAITRGGWQITTSLDLNMHTMAETAAREWIAEWAPAHDVDNASVVILKPGTGEILTMVGSLDYFDSENDGQVNVALQPRQPGSSIKPITYAAAMEVGWTTGDVLWDVPIKLDLGNGELMQPVNYDGRYHGPILLRDALANSYNIPPIELIRDIGIPTMISTARKMGITSLQELPGFYGLSITLGGGEVPLLEMSHAYATLANYGRRPQLTSILRIV
ncbi:MAG: penicillin-binding protein, partial [Anaerolineales bacterium]|nr:penicillin-binding protein [Anaerolineales bacterium]